MTAIACATVMEPAQYLDALRDSSGSLLASGRSDLGAPVRSCPGWSLTDLIAHMCRVWGWAASIVRTGARSDVESPESLGGTELIDLAEKKAEQVIESLEQSDPESNCWTFGEPRSRLFWFRRQALETAVHAWDAQQALSPPEPLGAALAADGIDEFASVFLPRWLRQHPEGWTGQSLHLHATDAEGHDGVEGEWMLRLGPDGAVAAERGHGKGDVAVRASASSLYLWCLNRAPSTELEIFGDRSLADRWTAEIAF